VLGWICVVGLLGLIPLRIVLRIKQKKEMAQGQVLAGQFPSA
jgi:hypothetical protein